MTLPTRGLNGQHVISSAEYVFRVRDDEPTPRVGATMHRTPLAETMVCLHGRRTRGESFPIRLEAPAMLAGAGTVNLFGRGQRD